MLMAIVLTQARGELKAEYRSGGATSRSPLRFAAPPFDTQPRPLRAPLRGAGVGVFGVDIHLQGACREPPFQGGEKWAF